MAFLGKIVMIWNEGRRRAARAASARMDRKTGRPGPRSAPLDVYALPCYVNCIKKADMENICAKFD